MIAIDEAQYARRHGYLLLQASVWLLHDLYARISSDKLFISIDSRAGPVISKQNLNRSYPNQNGN